jgi:hypothetical protein
VEVTKRGIDDGVFLKFADSMVDTTARRAHQVRGEIRHLVIKIRVQGLHIRELRGKLFLLLYQLSELVVKFFQPETISHDQGIEFIPLLCQGSSILSETCTI